jgi:CBS domain-containing protein
MPMNARDLMSRDVVTVTPDTPLREVARTLIGHGISAVPVVDAAGALVGMVSEGDLVGRKRTERETRSEWWLMRLAEGEPLSGDFLDHLQSPLAVAREVMSRPVIAVGEETPMDEIATLMAAHRVKRVPVLRDGRVVGIVRRADLLRAIGGGPSAPVSRPPDPSANPTAWLDRFDGERAAEVAPGHAATLTALPRDEDLSVDDFRQLVAHHREEVNAERARHHAEAVEHRRNDVRRLIDTHVTDNEWNRLLHGAREAAERGESEFLLLRFPNQLCSDGGRAINAPDPEWPATLRGEAAELYLRWERELRPRRFHLVARVIDFPDGVPGDIGMFLTWPG